VKDLIAKLEAATAGSRELDEELWVHLQDDPTEYVRFIRKDTGQFHRWQHEETGVFVNAPKYTTSLDAALTLVPEGYSWHLSTTSRDVFDAWCMPWMDVDNPKLDKPWVPHFTPALAICITALKAREMK